MKTTLAPSPPFSTTIATSAGEGAAIYHQALKLHSELQLVLKFNANFISASQNETVRLEHINIALKAKKNGEFDRFAPKWFKQLASGLPL